MYTMLIFKFNILHTRVTKFREKRQTLLIYTTDERLYIVQ